MSHITPKSCRQSYTGVYGNSAPKPNTTTSIYKIKAHVNIEGNERADKLAKHGTTKEYKFATKPYEFAHTTPFYYQKDEWSGPAHRPDKGPVRCLQTYIKKYDRDKT